MIHLSDNYGMDSISLGVTVSYVLSYNERHPEKPLLNGATFGDFAKIEELIIQTGEGKLPAHQPETNPGYAWAIAGGHMSMATYGLLTREGKADMESWVQGITQTKLQIVGFDMIGLCKFFDITKGICTQMVVDCLKSELNLDVTTEALAAAVHRAFLRGLALELRQGYEKEEYTLPAEVWERPNPNIKLPNITSPEFIAELQQRVWEIFEPELAGL